MAFREPRGGELRERVLLQKKTGSTAPPDRIDYSYPVVGTVWARVMEIFGGRIVEGAQTAERVTHNVTIRHRADVAAWDTLEYGPAGDRRRLRLVSVMDPTGRRRWLEILAEEERRGSL